MKLKPGSKVRVNHTLIGILLIKSDETGAALSRSINQTDMFSVSPISDNFCLCTAADAFYFVAFRDDIIPVSNIELLSLVEL